MPVNSRGQRVKTNKKNQAVSDTEARLRNPKKKGWGNSQDDFVTNGKDKTNDIGGTEWGGGASGIGNGGGAAVGGGS